MRGAAKGNSTLLHLNRGNVSQTKSSKPVSMARGVNVPPVILKSTVVCGANVKSSLMRPINRKQSVSNTVSNPQAHAQTPQKADIVLIIPTTSNGLENWRSNSDTTCDRQNRLGDIVMDRQVINPSGEQKRDIRAEASNKVQAKGMEKISTIGSDSMKVMDCLLSVGQMAVDKSLELGNILNSDVDTTLADGRDLLDLNSTQDLDAFIDKGKTLDGFKITELVEEEAVVSTVKPDHMVTTPEMQVVELKASETVTNIPEETVTSVDGEAVDKGRISLEKDFNRKCVVKKDTLHDSALQYNIDKVLPTSSIADRRKRSNTSRGVVTNVDLQIAELKSPPPAHSNYKRKQVMSQHTEALDLSVSARGSVSPIAQVDGQHDSEEKVVKKPSGRQLPLNRKRSDGNRNVGSDMPSPSSELSSSSQVGSQGSSVQIISSSESAQMNLASDISPTQPQSPPMYISSGTSTEGYSEVNEVFRSEEVHVEVEVDLSQVMNTESDIVEINEKPVEVHTSEDIGKEGEVQDPPAPPRSPHIGNESPVELRVNSEPSNPANWPEGYPRSLNSEDPVSPSSSISTVMCNVNESLDSFHEYQPEGYGNISTTISAASVNSDINEMGSLKDESDSGE